MAKRNSSAKKATKKASIRDQSITSSTTERTSGGFTPRKLKRTEQLQFLELISRGASPSAACQKLGVELRSLRKTLQEVKQFRMEFDDVAMSLNENVEVALYHAAMKGNVSAQTLWLRKRPPPGWMPDEERRTVSDAWDDLTDEELIALARSSGLAIPTELAARTGAAGGASESGGVSEKAKDCREG